MWTRIRGGIYLLAALLTICASTVAIHQYTATKEGRWIVTWVSIDTLKLFVVLVLLLLPWVAFMKSWFVERDFKAEKKNREDDYQAWIKERGREISGRCINEYAGLEKKTDDLIGMSTQNLELALGEFDARLEGIERTRGTAQESADEKIRGLDEHIAQLDGRIDVAIGANEEFRRDLPNLVYLGIEIQSWLKEAQRVGAASKPQQESRVARWEEEAKTFLLRHRPAFRDVFVTDVEPAIEIDALQYRLGVRIERLNALRAVLA